MFKKDSLIKKPLHKNSKVALISLQLGDSLISMVTVYNLRRNGYEITMFSDHIFAMREWFSNDTICPCPKAEEIRSVLMKYDLLIFLYSHDIIGQANLWHPNVVVLASAPWFWAPKSMIDIQVDICREELRLTNLVRINDLTPPSNLQFRKYAKRVIIHPTSKKQTRIWQKEKFVRLARKLQQFGYQPSFVVSSAERQDWLSLEKEGLDTPFVASLGQVAEHIYESSWLVGNDSGLGHLASNLGLGTVTLFIKASLAKKWRPGWAPSVVVTPPRWFIIGKLKEKYWKNFISVSRVFRACMSQKSIRLD